MSRGVELIEERINEFNMKVVCANFDSSDSMDTGDDQIETAAAQFTDIEACVATSAASEGTNDLNLLM